ncbi:MAG: DoxX family protein [Alistipes sp.]|nr:DoxX family protein [Alistipes sp.]
MKQNDYKFRQMASRQRRCAWALLFLRLFVGGVILLHIIGILQTYDNVVLSYRQILGMSAATSLAITIIIEGLSAAMIMTGFGTRVAATVMALVSAISLVELAVGGEIGSDMAKVEFLYMGIYITLLLSGGGEFAFNVPERGDENGAK